MRLAATQPRALPIAVTLGFVVAGAVAGLVVATGNLVLIALVMGAVAGIVLLNALPLAVWLLLVGIFLINGPVAYFMPGLARISWLFSLLGVFMTGAALLYAAVGRKRPAYPMPRFVYLSLAFVALVFVSAFFSNGSLEEIAAGAKRQFQFWGVMFLLAVVPFSTTTVRRWLLLLLGFALLQLPFSMYQRVVLMPQVMGWDVPGFVPFDIIVGTFEGSMRGGGASAIMAMYLVLAAVGLYCAYRERLLGTASFVVLLAVVLVPLGIGETKVVLMLIPVAMFFAFKDYILARPLLFLGGMIVSLVVIAALGYLYFMVQVMGEGGVTWEESLEATLAYNVGEKGYYGTGVNRLTAIPYWFQSQSWAEPLRALFGYGLGSSFGVDGRVPLVGHVFLAHEGMHIDLVSLSLLLWDFGFVGAALFVAILLAATATAGRCLKQARSSWDRTLCRILLASLGTTFLMLFYSASIVILVSHSFIVMFTLGLVAWRARNGPLPDDGSRVAQAMPSMPRARARGPAFVFTPPAGSAAAFSARPARFDPGIARAEARRPAPDSRVAPTTGQELGPRDSRGRIEPVIDSSTP